MNSKWNTYAPGGETNCSRTITWGGHRSWIYQAVSERRRRTPTHTHTHIHRVKNVSAGLNLLNYCRWPRNEAKCIAPPCNFIFSCGSRVLARRQKVEGALLVPYRGKLSRQTFQLDLSRPFDLRDETFRPTTAIFSHLLVPLSFFLSFAFICPLFPSLCLALCVSLCRLPSCNNPDCTSSFTSVSLQICSNWSCALFFLWVLTLKLELDRDAWLFLLLLLFFLWCRIDSEVISDDGAIR